MSIQVAIDGPAGSGKGTVTKLVAEKCNLIYIDTGVTYRCVTLKMLENGVSLEEEDKIIDIAKKIDTYDISILPFEDCCTIFVPEHPVINPTFENAREYEKAIDFESMIYDAIKGHEVIRVSVNDKNEEFEDLL